MASQSEPLVIFYDLAGPKPWSPFCWHTRFTLNYKGIPYQTIKVSYPDIKVTCEKLFGRNFSSQNIKATVPIIEILPSSLHKTRPQALNDSLPIAKFLNQVFTAELGFKNLEGIGEAKEYNKTMNELFSPVFDWIVYDVWANALKGDVRSQEFFRTTREGGKAACKLEDVLEVRGGGEEKILEGIRVGWSRLRERMAKEDGSGEPTELDFYDAAIVKWIEAASPEKFEKLLGIYGDDTFTKLMNKTEKYAF